MRPHLGSRPSVGGQQFRLREELDQHRTGDEPPTCAMKATPPPHRSRKPIRGAAGTSNTPAWTTRGPRGSWWRIAGWRSY